MNECGVMAACCLCFSVPFTIMLACSFSRLHTNELALDYNAISVSVGGRVYDSPGMHFLGVGHSLIKFPKTLQTIEYSTSDHDLLHLRTFDGLPLTLGVSFQYMYNPTKLYELYMDYGSISAITTQYENVASHLIATKACNYTAYQFFNNKQGIAIEMQTYLNTFFSKHLYATINMLQINFLELPHDFQDAILSMATVKQNITRMQKYQENMHVTFQTQVMVAKQSANQTVTLAQGKASQLLQAAYARGNMTVQTVKSQIDSYKTVKASLKMKDAQEVLRYAWWDALGLDEVDAGGKKQASPHFLVGVQPGMLVNTQMSVT